MNAIYARMERFRPYILSILRIVIGLLFLQHGLSKVFNFPAPSPVPSLSGLLILAAILETVGAAFRKAGSAWVFDTEPRARVLKTVQAREAYARATAGEET